MVRNGSLGIGDRDELSLPSQRLIEAALRGDLDYVVKSLSSELQVVDVNHIGTVGLRVKCIEIGLREEEADEVEIEYREFVTDVTPLFAAAHSGHLEIAKMLMSVGADINQQLFRGYATTAAARGGHCELLDMFLKAGASQAACEDALLEACLCGQAKVAEMLICSEMTGPDIASHALVSASCRGYADVVSTLLKNGVNINCTHRVLLRSAKPMLHANVNCTPLVAAIVSRQVSIVKYLLETGAKIDFLVRLGAWSWDIFSGEELRVGACLGEAYNALWCAVEYYEASGEILKLLLLHPASSLNNPLHGRTLLCHAILCRNPKAIQLLLDAGADVEIPIRTEKGHESRPLHLAARLGCLPILKLLISHGCEIDARTETGETALMMAAKADQEDCFLELVIAGADMGLVSKSRDTAVQLARRSAFGSSVADMIRQAVSNGTKLISNNLEVFSPLHFVAGMGYADLLQMILRQSTLDIDRYDGSGCTPIIIAAKAGHTEVFRLLIMAGADIGVKTRDGETIVTLLQLPALANDRDRLEDILLDAALGQVVTDNPTFRALHYAARRGNLSALVQLLKMGFPVNSTDGDGNTPLMLAAREGHADACKILLQRGADCELINSTGETALSLAKRSSGSKVAEEVIFDHLSRSHVVIGEDLCKHTREGRGVPHPKTVKMLKSGLLTWGNSQRRNVICKEAVAGPSEEFLKNQMRKNIVIDKRLVFRVVTDTGREVHFEASSSYSMELWVRGINLILKDGSSSLRNPVLKNMGSLLNLYREPE